MTHFMSMECEIDIHLSIEFMSRCSINGCFYQFEDNEKRRLHEKCHVSVDPDHIRLFKCLDCQIELKMWRTCTAHMWKEHKINIDMLECPCCSFKANLSSECSI